MADYHTSASVALFVTTDEAAILQSLFDWLDDAIEAEETPALPSDVLSAVGMSEVDIPAKAIAKLFWDPEQPFLAPHYTLTTANDGLSKLEIWGDQVEPDSIARVIFHLAKSALPVGFEWATGCSRFRAESFGGGFAAIFPDRIHIKSTRELLDHTVSPELQEHASPIHVVIPGFADFRTTSLQLASERYCAVRDESDLGASQFADGSISIAGAIIGRISYNGRVWEPARFGKCDCALLYDNRLPAEKSPSGEAQEIPHV